MFYPFKEQFQLVDDGGANGASEHVWIKGVSEKTIHVGGTFTADVSIEARLDASLEFEPIGMTMTDTGIAQLTGTYDQVRIVVTNYMSGTIVAFINGQQATQG